jgi:hypothetical protein
MTIRMKHRRRFRICITNINPKDRHVLAQDLDVSAGMPVPIFFGAGIFNLGTVNIGGHPQYIYIAL